MRSAYITDLADRCSGGGSYAVNWNAAEQLRRYFEVAYCGPLVPRVGMAEKLVSAGLRKVLRRPGQFAYFSPATLDGNAAMVRRALPEGCDLLFFRSAARWCRYRPEVPYFVYLDAVFHTFFHNTFRQEEFVISDLQRIWDEEAGFLERASGVFFESGWGLGEARRAYGLRGDHYHALGRGGVIEPPDSDTWQDGPPVLLTMAMKFRQKGGHIVHEAFDRLKARVPDLRWHILGGEPDFDWRVVEGVHYEGILKPDDPVGAQRLRALLSQAFLLLHPTFEDVCPLVLTEAAYFGCPSISVRQFGIPELVLDGQTGLLLDPPPESPALATAVLGLIEDRARYRAMRQAARQHALDHYSWGRIGDRMADLIRDGM